MAAQLRVTQTNHKHPARKPASQTGRQTIYLLALFQSSIFDMINLMVSCLHLFSQNSSNIWLNHGWLESSTARPGLFIFIMILTFHLNSNQNFKPFKMTDDRSLEEFQNLKLLLQLLREGTIHLIFNQFITEKKLTS